MDKKIAAAQVQGQGAAESVIRALRALQRVAEVDVIIVGRGGGSSDDLAAFNEEALVRAVAACRVPVVSAGGAFTDTAVLVFCTPGCETQPRTESAERPDCTIEPTFTCVPYALP